MKKSLIPFAIIIAFCFTANAQSSTTVVKVNNGDKNFRLKNGDERAERRRRGPDTHHDRMRNLSPEKRKAVNQEMRRHHTEMRRITKPVDDRAPRLDSAEGEIRRDNAHKYRKRHNYSSARDE